MNTNKTTAGIEDVKVKLSALWVGLMLLYIYADILSLFRPGVIDEMIAGRMGPFPATQVALLSAAILMAIPAVMVLLSLTMKARANRWANIIVGVLYTAVSINNFVGESWAYYILFCILETAFASLIVWSAWKWRNPEGSPDNKI